MRRTLRQRRLGYVLQVAANRRMPTATGPLRVDALAALAPEHA